MKNALYSLRDNLKLKFKKEIINDTTLNEIIKLKPNTIEELSQINDIDDNFIKNYGHEFIWEIKRLNILESNEFYDLNPNTEIILNKLESKLVNLNRRNKLIYLSKLYKKNSYDLYDENLDLNKLIFNKEKTEILLKKNSYSLLSYLFREITRDQKESGTNNLYIGYPFVEGNLSKDFYIKAPLVLFPVIYIKTKKLIFLKIDESRDTLYNTHLILAHKKNNKNIKKFNIPDGLVDKINQKTFFEDIIKYYDTFDLKIKNSNESLKEFSFNDSPHELRISNNIILGKFLVHTNSIQKDYDYITENKEMNNLLNTLLSDIKEESKLYINSDDKYLEKRKITIKPEQDLLYLNPLNSSQEEILYEANKGNNLVIEGPPGTGKSQTITALITQFINNNKSVLMVAEKKSALDVVYSRLKGISNYSLLIDNINDKETFYNQINNYFNLEEHNDNYLDDIKKISDEIDSNLFKFDDLNRLLYQNNNFGLKVYKLFLNNKKLNLEDEFIQSIINSNSLISSTSFNIKNIDNLYNNFDKKKLELINTFKENELYENIIKNDINNLNILINNYNNLLNRKVLFKNSKLNKIRTEISTYFSNNYNYPMTIINIDEYNNYFNNKNIINNLDIEEKLYYKTVFNLSKEKNISLDKANYLTYSVVIYNYLANFKSDNLFNLYSIYEYEDTIKKIDELLIKKQNLIEYNTLSILSEKIKTITNSKFKDDILSYCNAKRKKSIVTFFSKYNLLLTRGINIFLFTPEVVSEILPLYKSYFDLLIFDEASQMYIEKALPSLLRAKQVIIAGDSMQLRPASLGNAKIDYFDDNYDFDENPILEEESLLDAAKTKFESKLLNYHYRSKYEELINYSNFAFYKAKLNVLPNLDNNDIPIEYHYVEEGRWINKENKEEARYLVNLLKDLLNKNNDNLSFGIITFNTDQRDLIEDYIDKEKENDLEFNYLIEKENNKIVDKEDMSLFIKNIENVQGDERDIIIFSIGYAKDSKGIVRNRFGWLTNKSGENRLNVGVTRAKKKIIIVSSIYPNELNVEKSKNEGPKLLKKYLEYAYYVSNKNKEGLMNILNSFNTNNNINYKTDIYLDLKQRLEDDNYEVILNEGFGYFRLDMVIKKNGITLLGIEFDDSVYLDDLTSKERDYHRIKFFNSKGWKIHRLFSYLWYEDKEKEYNNIKNKLSKSFDLF